MTATATGVYEIVCTDTSALSRPDWLELRKQGLGSSDAAAAMGMSPWTSAYSLWAEKRNLLPEQEEVERFVWGRLLEPVILAEAEARGWIADCAQHLMLRSVEYPWMLANPDALAPAPLFAPVVEVKTADTWDEPRWDAGVPDHYVLQAHHLMIVTGRRMCTFLVLFGGNRLRQFTVTFDPAVAKLLIDAEREMWRRVQEDDAPDPDGSEATMLALRARYTEVDRGRTVELPATLATAFAMRAAEDEIAKGARARIDQLKATCMELMGDAEVGLLQGEQVCTWRQTKSGNRTFRFTEPKETEL